MDFLIAVYILLEKYLVPVVFVIGILYYLYGVINFFILSDTDKLEKGRRCFLAASLWFFAGLLIYGVVTLFGMTSLWLASFDEEGGGGASSDRSVGVELEEESAVLPVPNAPTRNEN